MSILCKKFEELGDPPAKFKRLDMKVKAAAKRIANHGILALEIDTKTSELESNGLILRGLQIIWIICKKNQIDEDSVYLFGFNDMNKVRLVNGDLASMITEWEATLARCPKDALSEKHVLEPMFFSIIETHPPLAEAVFHYNSVGSDHVDHSYQYLMAESKRVIGKQTVNANRARMQQAIAAGPSSVKPLGAQKALAASEVVKPSPAAVVLGLAGPVQQTEKTKRNFDRSDAIERGLCFSFQNGKCNKKECTFTHELAKIASRARSPSPERPRSNRPCMFFPKGTCNKGASCPFKHEGTAAASLVGGAKTE